MKLDPSVMRTMNRQDYRVLAAVETGMQSRALVPSPVITSIANLRHGGSQKTIDSLLRDNLLSHDQSCGYDGYRVTNSGYDILALWNLKCRGHVSALGDQIGVGKESDVYLAATPKGRQIVLKFHRLGRTSFRDVKKKRDYFAMNGLKKGGRGVTAKDRPNSWLFLSKMSAHKEFTFMKALHAADYTTPEPIVNNRHVVVMGLIRGAPLYQIKPPKQHDNTGITFDQALDVMHQAIAIGTQLARNGLVHCDLNEFNLMVDLSGGVQSLGHLETTDQNSRAGNYPPTVTGDGTATIANSRIAAEKDDVGDPYVRHSGSSASVAGRGRGALTLPHGVPLGDGADVKDHTGEVVTEEIKAEPHAYLDNGIDPKPVVTLIDFPQMISVRHPNAEELWRRDMDCLKRFFTMKLKCDVGEQEWDDLVPEWEDLILHLDEEADLVHVEDIDDDDDDDGGDIGDGDASTVGGGTSVLSVTSTGSLAPRSQLRLDRELHAAGFSKEDAERNMELYYYNNNNDNNDNHGAIQEEEEGEEGEEEEEAVEDEMNTPMDEYDGAITDSEDDETPQIRVYRSKKPSDDDEDSCSVAVSTTSAFSTMTTAQRRSRAEEIAKQRVRHHLDQRKKTKARKGAFRPRNSNKTFVKGKRVFQDFTA